MGPRGGHPGRARGDADRGGAQPRDLLGARGLGERRDVAGARARALADGQDLRPGGRLAAHGRDLRAQLRRPGAGGLLRDAGRGAHDPEERRRQRGGLPQSLQAHLPGHPGALQEGAHGDPHAHREGGEAGEAPGPAPLPHEGRERYRRHPVEQRRPLPGGGGLAVPREISSGPESEMLAHLTQRALDLDGAAASPQSPQREGGQSSQGSSSESDEEITSHSLGDPSNESTPAGLTNRKERVLCIAGVERQRGEVRLKVGLEERLKDIWVRMTGITHAPIHSLTFALGSIGRKLATSYPDHSLVLLSARPKVKAAKGFFESIMYRKFSKLYQSGQISSMPTLLPGSFSVSSRAMMFGILEKMGIVDTAYVWRSVAHKKAKDLGRYMDLYPECDFVFFGDNGQGDEQTALEVLGSGRTLLRSSGARLVAGFIHDVEKPRKEKLRKKLEQTLKDSDKMSDKMTKILSYLSPAG